MSNTMSQTAPYPDLLADLVNQVRYKENWMFRLKDLDRGQGSKGFTLVITIVTPDAYHPETTRAVAHYFPVPPAAFDMRSWRRWLFEQILLVEKHEAMEFFQLVVDQSPELTEVIGQKVDRPFAPSHGFGQDPYLIREVGTIEDQKTSFRNEVKP